METIAYINGDTQYGADVTFYINGTREQAVKAIVDNAIADRQFDDWEFSKYPEHKEVTDWNDKEQYRAFLTKILTKDITCLNSDLTKKHELYFYISVEKEWYNHFRYITGGRTGISIQFENLATGEKGVVPLYKAFTKNY